MITDRSISRNDALGTVQFYLLWAILFINVTAGIGILSQTSPMLQDMFHKTAAEAGTIVFIISLFNAGGRFFWASCSDFIGRRNTYTLFFVVQFALFLLDSGHGRARGLDLVPDQPVHRLHHVRRRLRHHPRLPGRHLRPGERRRDSRRGADRLERARRWPAPRSSPASPNSAKAALAPGASRVHIYDLPLEVLAAGLAVGFVLTLLVRPLKHRT